MVGKSSLARGKSDCRVLFGRSKEAFHNPGNIKFRQTISLSATDYLSAGNRRNRSKVVMSVWEYLLVDLKAEFYKLGSKKQWIRVPDREAKDKVSHALRDAARFEQRGSGSSLQKHQQPLARSCTPPTSAGVRPSKLPESSKECGRRKDQPMKTVMTAVHKKQTERQPTPRPVSPTFITANRNTGNCPLSPPDLQQESPTCESSRKPLHPGTDKKSENMLSSNEENEDLPSNAFELVEIEPIPVPEHFIQFSGDNSDFVGDASAGADDDDDWNELDQVLDGWGVPTQAQTPAPFVTPESLLKATRTLPEVHLLASRVQEDHFTGYIQPTPLQSFMNRSFQSETKIETVRTKGNDVIRRMGTAQSPAVQSVENDMEPIPF